MDDDDTTHCLTECPAGYYGVVSTDVSCSRCLLLNGCTKCNTTDGTCTECPGGLGGDGRVGCVGCPENTYQPGTGLICETCHFTRNAPVNSSECLCKNGTVDPGVIGGLGVNSQCLRCPSGSVCYGGHAKPKAMPGYYSSDDALVFIRCVPEWRCSGGDGCAAGYTGQCCSLCEVGWYNDNGVCLECGPSAKYALPIALLLFFMCVCMAYALGYKPKNDSFYGATRIALNFIQVTGK